MCHIGKSNRAIGEKKMRGSFFHHALREKSQNAEEKKIKYNVEKNVEL